MSSTFSLFFGTLLFCSFILFMIFLPDLAGVNTVLTDAEAYVVIPIGAFGFSYWLFGMIIVVILEHKNKASHSQNKET